MFFKSVVVLSILLLTNVCCQTISLTNFIQQSSDTSTTIPTVSSNLNDGTFNISVNQSFVPCGSADYCGQATPFKNDQDFQNFVNQYVNNTTGNALPSVVSPAIAMVQPEQQIMSTPNLMINSNTAKTANMIPQATPDFSGTNNQVQGVDEADLLKTDGKYIYTISDNLLSIILAYPVNSASVVANLSFVNLNPSAIFIEGNYLAVFGTQVDTNYAYLGTPVIPVATFNAMLQVRPISINVITYTWIKIYDVTNRARPLLVKDCKIQGDYFDGRKLTNGYVYLISRNQFNYGVRPNPWYDFGLGLKNALYSTIFWYPTYLYTLPSAVNIISFNLGYPQLSQPRMVTVCAEWTNVMYMSNYNIYLTTTSYQGSQDYTSIKKIFVNGPYIKPFADGLVRGTVNNQFSLDENGAILRIATTNLASGVLSASSNVFTLDFYLRTYGSLTGIAPGQKIYSALFVYLRLYLVTFRQVDPFFAISLANPRAPIILGQLKVPGYSSYLYPYDNSTIIGIGRDASDTGVQLGLKIGLFDVTNPLNPQVAYSWSIEQKYASSTAQYQHKAFLFSAQKNLLVIPGSMSSTGTQFNGAFTFYINKTYVQLRSVIDHILTTSDNFYDRTVQRSLYIDNYLYTKSRCLLRINQISTIFQGIRNINIPCNNTPQIKPYPVLSPPILVPPILGTLQKAS